MSTEEKEGKARNEEIENQLKKDKLMQRNEIKMLLLGMILPSRSTTDFFDPEDDRALSPSAATNVSATRCW